MADFSRYTNYKDNAGVSSVVFGARSTVLEVELNEMQEIQKHIIHSIIKNTIGNGITDIDKLVYEDGNIKLLDGCGIIAEGYYVDCSNVRYSISNGIAYLQVWEEVVNYNSVLNTNGHVNSSDSVDNWIMDPRASTETTRRKVVKYQISQSQDSNKINIPIARISNGSMIKLIKEVNLGKMYDKVDNMDTYDMRDVYGVEVDFESGSVTRLASSIGKNGGEDFNDIRAFDRKRCLITESDGNLLAYLNNAIYPDYYDTATGLTKREVVATNGVSVPSGSRVNVMVKQNKFYYKVVPMKIDRIYDDSEDSGYHVRKARYYISDTYKPGFKVHPAFIKTLKSGATLEFDYIFIGAYKSVAYDSNGLMNDSIYEDNAEDLDFSSGGMTSIEGIVPVSGLYNSLHMNNIRRLLTNMDADGFWRMKDITVMSMDILLFLIEYATFNAQNVIGRGCVDKNNVDNRFNHANETGGSSIYWNDSSEPEAMITNGIDSISYRGEEDIYGGLFEFIEGFRADNTSKWSNTLHTFGSYPEYENVRFHQDMGMSGFISAFGYNHDHDWMFIPTEANGNLVTPVGDTVSTYGAYDGDGYILAYGGNHYSGDNAGICNLRLIWDVNDASCGSRLTYFPYKIGKNVK